MQTSQTKFSFPAVFNPAMQTSEEIVSNFVVRCDEFNELFHALKMDNMEKPQQHYMIQGQRGYGKTTLLVRLKIEIARDEDLQNRLIPVLFDEEQYNIRNLAGLWEEVIRILEEGDESFAGLSAEADALYDNADPEGEIYSLLSRALKERKKKLVVLLDNFGDMIGKFSRKENQRLREVLITSSDIRLIGASSAILEFYYTYKEPFFDFFKVITLEELSREETIILLTKLGENYKSDDINKIIAEQPQRIDALRRLTGGVPRTIVHLFKIFVDDVDGNSIKDLEMVLDKVTPLYKHRLDSLSPQQQAIIDAIAQNWDAVSTKEIAGKVRMSSKAVSAQLNQLEKNQLISKIPTSTKNHLYQIKERFFNIYYLMRLGRRKSRNRVLWLVKFFEICCSEEDLRERTQRHIQAMQEERLYDKYAFYVSQSLSKTGIPFELQHELLDETRKYLVSKESEFIKDLGQSHIEVIEEAGRDLQKGDYLKAKKKLLDDGLPPADTNFFIANHLREQKEYHNSIQYYLDAVKDGHASAMFNLALLYETEFKDMEKAERYYLMAVEKGHAGAMNNLALLYETEFKDMEKAERYYLMAVEKGDAKAINNLALLYETEFKDMEKAERYYLMAVEKGHAGAMNNLASLYFELKKNKERALDLQRQAYQEIKDFNVTKGYIITLLWNDAIGEAVDVYREALDKEELQREVNAAINSVLLMFMAKNQYHFLYGLFQENKYDIRDKYKPVYYALLSLMGDQYADDLKKMGDELKESVQDVLKMVEGYREGFSKV